MAHSYSAYSTYSQCAAKYHYSYTLRLPRTPIGLAGQRGTTIHNSVEDFMLGKTDELHKDIHAKYGQWMYQMRNNYVCTPESKFAFTKEWKQVLFEDPTAYVRGFLDLRTDTKTYDGLNIYEWKTGKVYDTHLDQRFLYGLVGLLETDYKKVKVHGVYFDQLQDPPADEYNRDNINFMTDTWLKRFERMENDTSHSPNPGFLCRYCDFSKAKGGPCQF